ncbi:MAG: ATP synthase F1 subunit gamma [Bacteroidales bacterium]|nr:ATP synthase F1 subunit gamma [Bacteroidales bacterium]MBQ2397171.1 ATP synthase F1 subunit gamma [Bacteroidales bacterium]MED9961667.1 ATP synthase F1 subunit gamma [Bacteroidales bacterium]MEE0882577.1 ATP synthase F1 subunit gamma [Bacteroidales bacterium]
MANLKEIRTRIASVSSTQQITSAMKMVSASKLRKSQNAILKLRPYSAKMTEIIQNLCGSEKDELPLARQSKVLNNVLIIVLTSNKGLCSTFNSNVIKATNQRIEYYKENNAGIKIDVKTFGKKGTDFFKKQNNLINFIGENDDIWDNLSFENVANEGEELIKDFINKKYDKIEIIYNQFKNASTQILTYETFLPISFEESSNINNDYIFEPSKVEIINSIIPQSLKTQLFKCFLDSSASEHGARMTSMHKATDNATNLLKDLKLTYNKARQASITNEIIEICSGAEALK